AANRIAHAILGIRGEKQEQVGLLCNPGAAAIAATLGGLKAGKVYVPLDPGAPEARNRFILDDAEIRLILADNDNHRSACALAGKAVAVINVDDLEAGLSNENPGLQIAPDCLGYLMYTSGSTGEPKGVVQNHRNVLHKTRGWINVVHLSPGDRLSLLRALNVSGSIRDLFGALLCGAAVVPFDVKARGLVPLAAWLASEKITIFNSVVTLFRHFGSTLTGAEDFSSVRLLKLSGEPVHKSDMEIYQKHFPKECLAINMLSTAEVGSTRVFFMDRQTPLAENVVPIGYPMEGCEVLLLDADGGAVGVGQTGEIAVRSRHLSPGYWRRPDLTEAAFLPDPQGGDARIFRTGDLGCILPDGCLLHRGRKDLHVKIRGYSVELAEIEAALIALAEIKEAAVTIRQRAHGDQIVAAYIVPAAEPPPTVAAIRKALAAALPDYMIPSSFVYLDALPLIGPGKVDRRGLAALGGTRRDPETPFLLPRTAVEKKIAALWAELLELDQIGRADRFLDLGGDSLIASRIIARILELFRIEVPLRLLFDAPTVADLAAAVELQLAEPAAADAQPLKS